MTLEHPFTAAERREILVGYYASLETLRVAGEALDAAADERTFHKRQTVST